MHMRTTLNIDDKLIAEAVPPIAAAAPLRTIVPLIFDRGSPASLHPLLSHAASYGITDRRLIDLGDYEAALGFFPVAYRTSIDRPPIIDVETAPGNFDPNRWNADYIYTWKMPAGAALESRLSSRYEVVRVEGQARLYARKPSARAQRSGTPYARFSPR